MGKNNQTRFGLKELILLGVSSLLIPLGASWSTKSLEKKVEIVNALVKENKVHLFNGEGYSVSFGYKDGSDGLSFSFESSITGEGIEIKDVGEPGLGDEGDFIKLRVYDPLQDKLCSTSYTFSNGEAIRLMINSNGKYIHNGVNYCLFNVCGEGIKEELNKIYENKLNRIIEDCSEN